MIITVPDNTTGYDRCIITKIKQLGFDVAYDYSKEKFTDKPRVSDSSTFLVDGDIDNLTKTIKWSELYLSIMSTMQAFRLC